MTPEAVDRAARIILAARRGRQLLPGLPEDCRPRDLEQAYAVQDRLIELMGAEAGGAELGGWFVAATNVEIQAKLGLEGPYWARLLAAALHPSPASLPAADFLTITLEVEFAFRLGRDLPPRERPYEAHEVAAAVATTHPAIEVVSSHFEDWTKLDAPSLIADNGTDGALVFGKGVADWRALDLKTLEVSLSVNGEVVREGLGARALGDPLAAFTWLANARAARGEGLRAGHIHNTGTCTGMYLASPGDEAVADFGPLGEARVSFPI